MDIDLLRAIAVLAVMFFHFDIPGFEGGFLGVDIFFVISGYLISLHIQDQLAASRFSLKNFYLRRIRRLYPAMILTLLLSTIAAFLILPRYLFLEFSASQLASSVYVSNIYFWWIADYFDTASILKPLLHTWSLAVEEQFYLVWPFFLIVTFGKHGKHWLLLAILASLVAAEVAYRYSPSTAFYFFPFRIFEFAVGAMVCRCNLANVQERWKDLLFVVSVVAVVGSLTLIDEQSRTPGLLTIPLCAGTAAIIALSHPWANRSGLITRVFFRIGLVSYSAYLVHWPLVVFYKIYFPRTLSTVMGLVFVAVTYVLAECMYRFVEQPTSKIDLKLKQRHLLGLVPSVFLMALASYIWLPMADGLIELRSPRVQQILDAIPERPDVLSTVDRELERTEAGSAGELKRRVTVVGDSHAHDIYLSLRLVLPANRYKIHLQHSICDPLSLSSIKIPIKDLYRQHSQEQTKNPDYCSPVHETFLEELKNSAPDLIILSEAWREVAFPFFPETIKQVKEMLPGVPIIIMGRNFQLKSIPQVVFQEVKNELQINQIAWSLRYAHLDFMEDELARIARETDSVFVSKLDLVCPEKRCDILVNGELVYTDTQHWSMTGMKLYGSRLLKVSEFRRVLEPRF